MTVASDPLAGLDPSTAGAAAIIKAALAAWGLSTLYGKAVQLLKTGLSEDAVTIELEETPEFKTRFAGNETRRKAGLPVLSPGDYLQLEDTYRQVMRNYGLPTGFYDQPSDLANFIGSDVSPQELDARAKAAQHFVDNIADPAYKQVFQQYYGLTSGDAIAAVLDPKRALPLVQQQINAAGIGTAAGHQGLSVDKTRAEQLATLGVDESAAQKGYSTIGQVLPGTQQIASRYGLAYNQADAENEVLLGSSAAAEKRRKADDYEVASFDGSAGSASPRSFGSAAGGY